MKVQKQISLKDFTTAEGFVGRYQHLIKDVVIPYQYKVLCDEMEGVEKSHVIRNFINAGKALRGEDVGDGFYGMVFQDSDAAKWLEAVAYALILFPDTELEATADGLSISSPEPGLGRLSEHLLHDKGSGQALDQPAGRP